MDITFASLIFASRTIPTDFGLVAAAIAGAGSLLFMALRVVPDAGKLIKGTIFKKKYLYLNFVLQKDLIYLSTTYG